MMYSSVQLFSLVPLFATPWPAARQISLSITNSQSSLRLTSIESVMPSSHLIHCPPLLLLHPIPPSIAVFSSESALHIRWPKYWSFCFSNSHPNEYSGLISFRIDWFDLLAVQGTLKRLLQHRNSKVSILRCSVFFLVQLSHPDYVQNIQIGQGRSKECLYRSWLLSLPLRQELKAKFLAWSLGPSLGCRPHKLRRGSLFRSLITLQCLE